MASIAALSQGCAAHSWRIQKTCENVTLILICTSYIVACGLVHVRQAVLIGIVHLVIFVLFPHRSWLACPIFVACTHGQHLPFWLGRAYVQAAQAAWIVMKLMLT